MNQKLRLLLHKHFNWSFEFSNGTHLSLEHQKLLVLFLEEIDNALHLQPHQLLGLIQSKKLDLLYSYLEICYDMGHFLQPSLDKPLNTQFKKALTSLLEFGFTVEQLSQFSSKLYLTKHAQQQLFRKITFVTNTFDECTSQLLAAQPQTLFSSAQTSPETVSSHSNSDDNSETVCADVDDETWEILRNL